MDRVLILNSVDGDSESRSHDFTIEFTPPLDFGASKHHVGVDKIFMSNSWYNIFEKIRTTL